MSMFDQVGDVGMDNPFYCVNLKFTDYFVNGAHIGDFQYIGIFLNKKWYLYNLKDIKIFSVPNGIEITSHSFIVNSQLMQKHDWIIEEIRHGRFTPLSIEG